MQQEQRALALKDATTTNYPSSQIQTSSLFGARNPPWHRHHLGSWHAPAAYTEATVPQSPRLLIARYPFKWTIYRNAE